MDSTLHSMSRTADVPSLSLRTAISALSFVSDLCGVDVHWFQDNSSQELPNSKELSVSMTFGFLVGSRNFMKLFWVFWEDFVLHGWDCSHWVAKSCTTTACQWLFRDSFCSLRTLWSGSHQISEIFRSGHDYTSASSAENPCYIGLQAYFTIWILRKVREGAVFARIRFHACSRLHWRSSEVLSPTKFSLNSCSQSRNSCAKSYLYLFWFVPFWFWFSSLDSCNGSPRSSSFTPLFLSDTGASTSLFSDTESLLDDVDSCD